MSRALVVIAGLALATCGPSKPTSFGVNITVVTGMLPDNVKASISSFKLHVSGAEKFDTDIPGVNKAALTGEVHFRYIPGIQLGALNFDVDAADGNGVLVSSGSSPRVDILAGAAVEARIVLGKAGRGAPCNGDTDCSSGLCADKVCCDTICDGVCESCNLTGTVGFCTPIPDGTDPAAECGAVIPPNPDMAGQVIVDTDMNPPDLADQPDLYGVDMAQTRVPDGGLQIVYTSCSGTCNGSRGCRFPSATQGCGSVFCSDTAEVASMVCDGAGGCQQKISTCIDYTCGAGACKTQCAAQTDCTTGAYCDGATSHCVPTKSNGVSCVQPFECVSGYCTNGVCCNSQCNIPGGVCNQAGNVGTCVCSAGCAGVGCQVFYADTDGDGFGNKFGTIGSGAVVGCTGSPPAGFVADNTDCDDGDGNVHPGQTAFFPTPSKGSGTFDYNCDGVNTHSAVLSGAQCVLATGTPFSGGCSSTTACGTSTAATGLGVSTCISGCSPLCFIFCCGRPTEGYIGDATCGQPASYRWCYNCYSGATTTVNTTGNGTKPMACN